MSDHPQGILISGYIDQELNLQERRWVETHIASCAGCRDEMARLRSTKLQLAAAPRRAMPADLLESLERHSVRPQWRKTLESWWSLPSFRAAAEAMAVATVVLTVWFSVKAFAPEEGLPLEPLLAAHSRYAAEGLVPPGDLVASNFSDQLAVYHAQ